MHIRFTKMQGAGNDFVVLNETQRRLNLSAAQYRWLADRHFGVGADQILSVRPAPHAGVDFEYIIHNADGHEVEHCGNGARCFVRYVRDQGLTDKTRVRVQIQHGTLDLQMNPDGRVTVNMGAPIFEHHRIPFAPPTLQATAQAPQPAQGPAHALVHELSLAPHGTVRVAVLSMGNPHAVCRVTDAAQAPVALLGPLIESHSAFAKRVNVGFMQVHSPSRIHLRVHERGAGETLACGTGACAAVVAGIAQGWLDSQVDVHTRGGLLTIHWSGQPQDPVHMTGPATPVFEGTIDIPEL